MHSQVAVKAVIINALGQALIMREGDRWQAPGGRLERGEKLRDGLRREILEETGIHDLKIHDVVHVDEWFSQPEGELAHIVALFFHCQTNLDAVILSNEHNAHAWVTPDDLKAYSIEPEIKIAIEKVLHNVNYS